MNRFFPLHRWPLSFLLLALFMMLAVPATHAQERSLYWDRLDVEIDVQADGTFDVREINALNFTEGEFRFGTRAIPTEYSTGLTDVAITVNGQPLNESERDSETPGTFTVNRSGTMLELRYYFPEAPVTGRQEVVIAYTVQGGIRHYEEGDQLYWKAVHADRPATIEQSEVTVTLPAPVSAEQLVTAVYATEATTRVSPDGQSVTFQASEAIPPGQEMEVRVQFPDGLVAGVAPPWQAGADQAAAEAEEAQRWGTVASVLAGGFSLLLGLGGLGGIFMLWFSRGRDEDVPMIAEYLTEPPSDLSPGVVGTLLDEKAEMQDILAMLLDLARRGALSIEETDKGGLFSKSDFTYRLLDEDVARTQAERVLLRQFFGGSQTRDLDDLKDRFYKKLPKIQDELYDEVVAQGFFDQRPDKIRQRYLLMGMGLFFVGVPLFIGGVWFVGNVLPAPGLFCLPATLVALGILLIIAGSQMPRKSRAGIEAAARWQAFRRYLDNIEKYGDLAESKARWDEYLPYAVAFGLEKEYIDRFAKVDAPIPYWYSPYGYGWGHRHHHGHHGTPSFGGGEGGLRDSAPSAGGGGLQGASDSMAGGLKGVSAGLATMLSTTGSTLTSQPSSSGSSGGFSGGGGGGGFGGGGGSSSFG